MYVVAVGASAGGLEALQSFVKNLSLDLDCGYIVAQHLSPVHKSMMVALLAKDTQLNIVEASDNTEIEKGFVYVIPPDKDAYISEDRKLRLQEAKVGSTPKPSIDLLLESLGKAYKDKAVALILSGTGSDGSKGIAAVKAHGGIVMAQEPSSAKYDGMPNSAIHSGFVDSIILPEDFAIELDEILYSPASTSGGSRINELLQLDLKEQIFATLAKYKNIDFSSYKKSTVNRRIDRRMSALKLSSLTDYVSYLSLHQEEMEALYRDMLIGVTSFFRDRGAFDALGEAMFSVFGQKNRGDSLRVWVAGCSTGEEAYSIAIVIAEVLSKMAMDFKVQIFATDINDESIDIARRGHYESAAVSSINKNILKKYFVKKDDGYDLIKPIRDMIIFSAHDLVKDPPFSKIDLLCCRNVMIYFDKNLQSKVLGYFHNALEINGLLFLGKSESVASYEDFFVALDKNEKIFKSLYSSKKNPLFHSKYTIRPLDEEEARNKKNKPRAVDIKEKAREIIGELVFPYYVVMNESYDILYFSGEDNPYFTIGKAGYTSLNLFRLIDEQMSLPARSALQETKKTAKKALSKIVFLEKEGERRSVQLVAQTFAYEENSVYYVLGFLDLPIENFTFFLNMEAKDLESPNSYSAQRIRELEYELSSTKDYLQTVVEQLETSSEELQASNEELQSGNEELQSSNEELQTTNEELQSTNEELQVAYTELRLMYEERDAQKKLLEEKMEALDHSKALNEELEKQVNLEAFAASIFKTVSTAICLTDDDENIVEINDYFCVLTGYAKKDVIGISYRQILQPKATARQSILNDTAHSKNEEWTIVRKNKKILTVLSSFTDSSIGTKKYKIITMLDITEQKRLEEKEKEQEATIIEQSRNAQMGEMIGMIAHQWRQPLNVISIISSDIEYSFAEGTLTDDGMKEHHDAIQKQLKYMSKTIDDFRSFFKKGESKPFSLADAAQMSISLSKAQLSSMDITLASKVEDCKVLGNENQLVQVLITLITNSKDAILERKNTGRINGVIEVISEVADDTVTIRVLDNGKGADEAIVSRIFEPYFTTKHPSIGTGIGLNMAFTVITKNFGGKIYGQNRPDGGFEMIIVIPKYKG